MGDAMQCDSRRDAFNLIRVCSQKMHQNLFLLNVPHFSIVGFGNKIIVDKFYKEYYKKSKQKKYAIINTKPIWGKGNF
jgi:hypothetical protein